MWRFSSVLIHESFVSADEEPALLPFQLLILALYFLSQEIFTTKDVKIICFVLIYLCYPLIRRIL